MQKSFLFVFLLLSLQACKPNESTPVDSVPDIYAIQSCSSETTRDSGQVATAIIGTWNLRRKLCPSNGGEITVSAPVRMEITADRYVKVYSNTTLLQTAHWSVQRDSTYGYGYSQWRVLTDPAVDWMYGYLYICDPYLLFSGASYYIGSGTMCDHVFQKQ